MIGCKGRVFVAVLTAGLLAVWSIQVASANHLGEYLAEDSGQQSHNWPPPDPWPAGFENYVYRYWHLGYDAWWAAVNEDIKQDAVAVMGNWNTAIPELDFYDSSDNLSLADLYFYSQANCTSGRSACFVVTDMHWDVIRQANFVNKAQIRLSPGYYNSATTEQKREAIAHELGHFYGLHERYIGHPVGPSSCNDSEATVMDTVFPGTLDHCDNTQGPLFEDTARVLTYWKMGQMDWLSPVLQSNGGIRWEWKDYAWAEEYQQFNAFWWDPTINEWRQYVQWFPYQDRIGLHEAMKGFTEERVLSKVTASPPESKNRWHVACGHPFFKNFLYDPDNWTCSPEIFVAVPSLVGHWKFDDGWGTTATDSSGYGNPGTLVSNPAWSAPGRVGPYAISLDGVDDYVTVGDSASLTFGTGTLDKPFSIALWAKPDVITGKVNGLLSKAIEYNQGEYALLLEWSRVTFRVIDDSMRGTLARNADGAVSTPGSWYHIVGTYDGSRTAAGIAIYVNGALVNSANASGGAYVAMEDTSYSVSIGDYRPFDPDRFDGLLDDVRIYNYALTAAEVQALCNCP